MVSFWDKSRGFFSLKHAKLLSLLSFTSLFGGSELEFKVGSEIYSEE
uniref:Uncharacterized protein n=1 Tax=Rhizophora mucronata TaxID=61149 RepID=A0A2P2PXK2_RHIMU